jgi:thiosulfate dehydrogenase
MFRGFVLGVLFSIFASAAAGYLVVTNGAIPLNGDAQPFPLEEWAARTALHASLAREAPRGPNHGGVEDDPEGYSFWKIKHGIRWTAMPAWQHTLSDQQIWTLALFLTRMDKLPPAPEQAWQQTTD